MKWAGVFALALVVALVLFVAFGLNLLRGPISRAVSEATGRELVIAGDLTALWSWTHPRFRAEKVSYANPEWASEEHLLRAEAIEASISLLPLLYGRVVVPEVHLEQPEVALEQRPDGRKTWLLDRDQKDRGGSRFYIRALTLDQGRVKYDEPARRISIAAELTSEAEGVTFSAKGRYKGLPLKAKGSGDQVLALRDAAAPYPLKGEARIGSTDIKVDGTFTNIAELAAFDLAIDLRGSSMVQLYEVFGIAFPDTSPYTTRGRLIKGDGRVRYEEFAGKVGKSDLAGTFQVDTGGKRPFMSAELRSKLLNFADLGPLVGTTEPRKGGLLPNRPFDTARWGSVDADVRLRAGKIERPAQLPLEDLAARIRMRDKVLELEPLEFGIAGGTLAGSIRLDGSKEPIRAAANLRVRKLELAKLFPTIEQAKASKGEVSGLIELAGRGNSVARMLGSADGKIGLFVDSGQVSRFLMELATLDLWGIARTKLAGDKPVEIRCAIADFGVKDGVLQTNALVFDTAVVNIGGSGRINLQNEAMDLELDPEPKDRSLASLNSPLYIRGTFGAPEVSPDAGKIAAKGLGALLLGAVNPLLAVIPLIEKGPGKDSNCGKLIAEAAESSKRSAATGGSGKPAAKPRAR
jgi:AsmA protein